MRRLSVASMLSTFLLVCSPALAHHGRDFLFSQTADLPHPGQFFLIPRQDYVDEGDVHEVEFEPAILVGVLDWLACELHAHAAKESGQFLAYEATAATIHLRLTPKKRAVRVGLSGEYEFSHDDEREDRVEARLTMSAPIGRSLLALNLVTDDSPGDDSGTEWGYSAGWRRETSRHVAYGLEAQGSLEGAGHETLAGLYLDPASRLTVNLGVGLGLSGNELDFSIRTVFVWRIGQIGSNRK